MVVVRPARLTDLDAVERLLETAGHGLTTLPKDVELLKQKVVVSSESFAAPVGTLQGESYLLVLEDLSTGRVAGTSGITAKVGSAEPFYTYQLESHVFQSATLNVRREVQCLHLVAERRGPTEIGSLFLSPEYRAHGVGRLLSLSRFLLMAEEPSRFEREVIAEMRGVVDERGRSPFWEALGRHFFDLDFPRADYLSVKNKHFIAELMPRHPIYLSLLPPEAREVVGKVHPQTAPALRLLEEEGFRFLELVDIFDGGPVVGCPRTDIRTIRESRAGRVVRVESQPEAVPVLVARSGPEFRACLGRVGVEDGGAVLEAEAAEALEVGVGDRVRWAPLRSKTEGAKK